MPKTHVITLRVDESLARRIIKTARKQRHSMNSLIANVMDDYTAGKFIRKEEVGR